MAEKTNEVVVPPIIYVSFDDDGEIEYSATNPEDVERGTTRVAVYNLSHMAKVTHDVTLEHESDTEVELNKE